MQKVTILRITALMSFVIAFLLCLVIKATSPQPIQAGTFRIIGRQPQSHSAEDLVFSHFSVEETSITTSIAFSEVLTETFSISSTASISVPLMMTTPGTEFSQPIGISASSPVLDKGIIAQTINNLIEKPLIPLGFLLVILFTLLAVVLITPQRKVSKAQKKQKSGRETTPLMPKTTPSQDSAFLTLKDDPDIIYTLAINDIRIGRSTDNTIVITSEMPGSETVSRYHARLYRLEKWVLEDLDSKNGVYVNGQRTGRNYLQDGWEIGIGAVSFIFHTSMANV